MRCSLSIGLLILSMFLISGCATVAGICLDDGYCSIDEKIRGNCFDCMPDFSIVDDTFTANFEVDPQTGDGQLRVSVLLVSQNEFEGELPLEWGFESNANQAALREYADLVSFDVVDIESYYQLDVDEGVINTEGNIKFNADEASFAKAEYVFSEVKTGESFEISLNINSQRDIAEKDYSNNYGEYDYSFNTNVSYLEGIIMEDLGPYVYEGFYGYDGYSYNVNEYWEINGKYQLNESFSVTVVVSKFEDAHDAQRRYNENVLGTQTEEVIIGTQKLLAQVNSWGTAYSWVSGKYIIKVYPNTGELELVMPILGPYLALYPSVVDDTTYTKLKGEYLSFNTDRDNITFAYNGDVHTLRVEREGDGILMSDSLGNSASLIRNGFVEIGELSIYTTYIMQMYNSNDFARVSVLVDLRESDVTCIDSDEENDIYTKGTLVLNTTNPFVESLETKDYCLDDRVVQRTCADFYDSWRGYERNTYTTCENGCIDGACIGDGDSFRDAYWRSSTIGVDTFDFSFGSSESSIMLRNNLPTDILLQRVLINNISLANTNELNISVLAGRTVNLSRSNFPELGDSGFDTDFGPCLGRNIGDSFDFPLVVKYIDIETLATYTFTGEVNLIGNCPDAWEEQ